jgi:hypothetical protein
MRVSVCARVCVRSFKICRLAFPRVRVHQRCAGTRMARAGTGGIYSSAATVGRPRVRFALVIGRSRALAAGVSWTLRNGGQWGWRRLHTSVIDAAGAIYVIGGMNGGSISNGITTWTCLRDVWKSTDAGARPD